MSEAEPEPCGNCGRPLIDGWVVTIGPKEGARLTDDHVCPECGARYGRETVACPSCRVVLTDDPPFEPGVPVVIHRVPDAAQPPDGVDGAQMVLVALLGGQTAIQPDP